MGKGAGGGGGRTFFMPDIVIGLQTGDNRICSKHWLVRDHKATFRDVTGSKIFQFLIQNIRIDNKLVALNRIFEI